MEGLVCFALWVAYGIIQARRSQKIRQKVVQIPIRNRTTLGIILIVLGIVFLFGSLIGLQAAGLAPNGRPLPGAWPIVFLAGLAFVHAQTMGMAMLVSTAHETVTSQKRQASDQQDTDQDSSQP